MRDDLLQKDPRNVLLHARCTRLRMPAEMVRDNALAASGLLVRADRRAERVSRTSRTACGTGIYGSPTIRRPTRFRPTIIIAAACIRSSSATRRIPAMATFDLPDRGRASARRRTSNTPLQALVLLDDPQFLEAYRALATPAS